MGLNIVYRTRRIEPIIMAIPSPRPKNVGHSVPVTGRIGRGVVCAAVPDEVSADVDELEPVLFVVVVDEPDPVPVPDLADIQLESGPPAQTFSPLTAK
jgi:hypothetical protein